MIDFRKAEESFKNYLKDYDVEDGNIKIGRASCRERV